MGFFERLFGKQKAEQVTINTKVKQEIFGEMSEFDYSDFHDLKTNTWYDRFFAGTLQLPTGKVVCTDPLYRELGLPQSWAVKPGNYPVYLYISREEGFAGRIAYSELVIKEEIPYRWEFSLIPEALLESEFEKKMNGLFPVETGLGSFSDYDVWKSYNKEVDAFYAVNPNANYYKDFLEILFKDNANVTPNSRGKDWINYKLEKCSGNIIMFASGLGDGLYPRYVGFDKNGKAIKLIADFIQLTNEENPSP
ncbi:MAG: DUF4241 domain-containing protein [Chitinophagales bacterium]|nr:DUF4241 domain-containing protein [Chitinophagales bacterium]